VETSLFDLNDQNQHIESKIVVALERISEAFRVLLWQESKEFGLSPIQIQLLIFISLHSQQYCKVSYLAQEFNLTKPTISDAVKSLEQKKLIEKFTDTSDTRSYSIKTTLQGEEMAKKLMLFANVLKPSIENMDLEQKNNLWESLMNVIVSLQQSGIITLQRMCFSCTNYEKYNGIHFCKLLKINLQNKNIRIDCQEHQKI
jgi:DNA-binding MarR family transcriptional regulator